MSKPEQVHPPPLRSIGIMAKHWIPGQVKTRLAKGTNDHVAAEIHRQFTLHLTEQLACLEAWRFVFVAPDHACGEMQSAVGSRWTAMPQGDGDLGNRMSRALQFLLAKSNPSSSAILIGADLPTLLTADIDYAFDKLEAADLVLGPAVDGGYYLIGLRGPWRSEYEHLFDSIPWSTSDVYSQTMKIADEMGIQSAPLVRREDVDNLESLQRILLSNSIDRGLKKSILAIIDKP